MSQPKSKVFWFALTFLAAFGIARVVTVKATQGKDVVGKQAPAFRLESVDGQMVDLAKLKGKVVLMDFWAVWCGPCKKSMPFFQELSEKYRKDGLEVIGVHVDDRVPPKEEVAAYLAEAGVSYTNVISTIDTDNAFVVFAMPTTYFIDKKGVISKRHIGYNPDTAPEEIETAVRGLLGLD